MRRLVLRAGLAAFATIFSSNVAGAQAANVPTRTLAVPEIELAEPFTRLMGVRELSDGRLVVSDLTEKFIAVVDLSKKSVTKLGTVGSGPGEYTMPGAVIAYPGDTTLVSDMFGRKYIRIAPNGTLAGEVAMPAPAAMTGPGGGRIMSIGGLSVADANGRIYSLGASFRLGADGQLVPTDSAPITRMDLRSGRSDTVTFLKVPMAQVQTTGAGGQTNVNMRIGGPNIPFVVQQAWTVAADGRVALVTPDPYRVTWVSTTGQKTVGQPIAYNRIRVSESEKNAYREAMKASPPTGVTMRVGGPGNQQVVQQGPMAFTEPDSWPEFKHPFAAGVSNVVVSPTGELWVLKQLSATEKNPTFDVIGPRGELTGRVVLPQSTRLLGFGRNGTVYLVRRDADDLEYIQRHKLTVAR